MNKFFDGLFIRSRDHATDEDLLLLLDGEISSTAAHQVHRHFEGCWICRRRYQQIQGTVFNFVGYHKQIVDSHLPLPPGGKERFLGRLDELIQESNASLRRRVAQSLRVVIKQTMNPVLTSLFIAAAAVLALFIVWQRNVPSVSANELLERAEQSYSDSERVVQQPVVYQKIRIQSGQKSLTRRIWRDTVQGRGKELEDYDGDLSSAVTRTSSLDEANLSKLFSMNRLFWNDPLSPTGYQRWRSAAGAVTDEIFRPNRNELTVRTSVVNDDHTVGTDRSFVANPQTGRILKASLTVRAKDFHPLTEHFEVEWNTGTGFANYQVDVTELDYTVLTGNALSADFFEVTPAEVPSRTVEPRMPGQPTIAPAPSLMELADVEVAARFALHRIGADLGDPINLHIDIHQKSPSVVVDGVVSSIERKQELLQALSGIPHVKISLQAEEEAVSQNPPLVPSTTTIASESREPRSPIEKQLLEYFGSSDAVEAFSEHALGITKSLMASAWALHHLSERYPDFDSTATSSLSLSSRELLKAMMHDYRSAMGEQTTQLKSLLNPVLLSLTSMPTDASEEIPVFDRAQRTENVTLYLLFGTELPDAMAEARQPVQAARDLLKDLNRLEGQLKSGE